MGSLQKYLTQFIRTIAIVGGWLAICLAVGISSLCFWLASTKVGLIVSGSLAAFGVLVYGLVYKKAFDQERLLELGIPTPGKILNIEETLWREETPVSYGRIYRFEIEVLPAAGVPYQVVRRTSNVNALIEAFHRGLPLTLRIDPRNPKKFLVEKAGNVSVIDKDQIWDEVLHYLDFTD